MTNDVSFSKLHSGDWGVSGPVDLLEEGSVVTVTKRSGATAKVTIKSVIWDNGDRAVASIEPKKKTVRNDKPEPGKVYRLTGGRDTPSVARGDPLEDCVVENESAVEDDRSDFARECEQWLDSPTGKAYRGIKTDEPVTTTEPAVTPAAGWGQCRDCGAPGICDGRGLGLSCGCGFE